MEPGPWLAGVNQHSSYMGRLIPLKLQLPRTGVCYRDSRWEAHLLKAILLMQMKADGTSTAGNTNLWRASEHPVSFNDPFNALVILPFSHNSIALNMQETYCLQGRVFLGFLLNNNLSWLSFFFSVVSMIFARQKSRGKIMVFTKIHMGFKALMWLLCESTFFQTVTLSKCVFWSISMSSSVVRWPEDVPARLRVSFSWALATASWRAVAN